MKVVGNFNKLSQETLSRIKPLKKGQQVHYRLLTGSFDMISGETRFGALTTIRGRDTILDGDNLVDIGVPRTIEKGEVKRCKKFYVSPLGDNILHKGVFTLYADKLEDREWYEFFEVCNANNSNPFRDKGVLPKFERINEEAEADKVTGEIDQLTQALIAVSEMSNGEIVEFAQIMNWNTKESPAVLKSRVKTYAKDEPVDFLAKVVDPENKTKVIIKKALDAGIISYNPAEHKIIWKNGSVAAKLDRAEEGETELDCFYRWTREKSNGENIIKAIKNQLKNSQNEAE